MVPGLNKYIGSHELHLFTLKLQTITSDTMRPYRMDSQSGDWWWPRWSSLGFWGTYVRVNMHTLLPWGFQQLELFEV